MKSGSKTGAKREGREVYGTIAYFVVNQEVTAATFGGDGDIVYRRYNDVTILCPKLGSRLG